MKKLAFVLIAALCLLSVSAPAEVRRGDRGEEVRYLQWLLHETEWLSDKPDGSFGPRTESAVMEYQKSKGYEETGVADDALMLELDEDRVRRDQEEHGSDYYQPYPGNYEPAMIAAYGAPDHCKTTVLRDMAYRDSCTDHLSLLEQEYSLTARGDVDGYAQAAGLWRQAIDDRFDAWGASDGVLAARDAWNACFEAQYAALKSSFDDPVVAERQLTLMLKNYAGAMCEFLSGGTPAAASEEYQPGTGSAEPFCRQWSINAGTEFFTGCAVHAPLFDREYEWTCSGANDAAALNAIAADWDSALAALYDQWALVSGNEEAVRAAQSACASALDRQDEALAGTANAPLARVRTVQMECARLCELLNGR